MGWFSKKEEKNINLNSDLELPKLPELPKLKDPEFFQKKEPLGRLPSIPSTSSLSEKFSQDIIKDAVTGKKEDEEVFDADESEEEQMMQKPLRKLSESSYPSHSSIKYKLKTTEPVFVRIDKFEESLHLFDDSKKKIMEIEKMISETKKIREKEERELESWEAEIQNIKKHFEKIDRDVFSKIG